MSILAQNSQAGYRCVWPALRVLLLGKLLSESCSMAGVICLRGASAFLSNALHELVFRTPASSFARSDLEIRSLSMFRLKTTCETVQCQEGAETKCQIFRQDFTGSLALGRARSKCLWVLTLLCWFFWLAVD